MTSKKKASTAKKSSTKTTKKAAPKVAKKAAVKKTTQKKSAKPTKTGKALVCAQGDQCFWVHEGPILRDLQELEQALQDMSEAIFAHHVSKKHNDFADWIEGVLDDAETAALFRKSLKPATAHKVLVKQLKLYSLS